jgi:hypothetical protein
VTTGSRWMLLRITAVAAIVAVGMAWSAGGAAARNQLFTFGGSGCATWTAPRDASALDIEAVGAAGTDAYGAPGYRNGEWFGSPGLGDEVTAILNGPVNGAKFDVCINAGNKEIDGNAPGGGGASGVAVGSNFRHPAVVAGGGGAAGETCTGDYCYLFDAGQCCNGGNAGYPNGASGQAATDVQTTAGAGGTTLAGGAGGIANHTFYLDFNGGPGALSTPAGPGTGGVAAGDGGNFRLGGGAGYAGGGAGAVTGAGTEDGGPVTSGGGGGSDYCAPKTPSRSDAELPSKFSTTDCKIIGGVGTKSVSGTTAGDAEVVITSVVVPEPPVAAITWPYVDESFVTSGTTTRAGALSSLPAPGAGAYPPVAKFSCIRGAHAAPIKSCTAVVVTDLGRVRAPKLESISSGQTLPASAGGDYPSYISDSLKVTAVSQDGKKTSQTDVYRVYTADTYPLTAPGFGGTP